MIMSRMDPVSCLTKRIAIRSENSEMNDTALTSRPVVRIRAIRRDSGRAKIENAYIRAEIAISLDPSPNTHIRIETDIAEMSSAISGCIFL